MVARLVASFPKNTYYSMFIEPVFGKKFFGREDVLATLHKRVTALKGGYRQNLALTGPMLAGKSSILRHFLKDLKDPDIIPLYIEMTGEDFNVFCTRFMATLLYNYMKTRGVKPEGEFEDLVSVCREMVPDTIKCIDSIIKSISKKKYDDAYEKLLGLTSVFKVETGKSCIVILDEFQNMSGFQLKKPFNTFGKFIMVQKNTMYVVSSSQKSLLQEILSKKLSLLFGNFEIIEVNGFDSQTAKSFIADKLDVAGEQGQVVDYLVQVSQGSPFYLEVFSKRFSDTLKKDNGERTPKECLLDTFAGILYDAEGILSQYFNNNINFFLEKKARKKLIPILTALATGHTTIKSIQSSLGKVDRDLGSKLSKLIKMDLVYNSGQFFRIEDKLFEYWLKNVYCLKTKSMIDDLNIKYLEFKHAVEEDFTEFGKFSSKNVIDHLTEVFSSFNGEKVRIGYTDRKMPRFDKIKVVKKGSNVSQILAYCGEKAWIFHVKQNDISDEQDIHDLWGIKKLRNNKKIVRRIFIPLKGIEQNAFLLAKEQNVWVWDVRQLNEVLRLFGNFEFVI